MLQIMVSAAVIAACFAEGYCICKLNGIVAPDAFDKQK